MIKKEAKIKGKETNFYIITGQAKIELLQEVSSKYHHLVNAMQNPTIDIYQELNIKIPSKSCIKHHETGIYDNQFIIFELAQILMENQQSSLVNKTVLNPDNLERFINFLKPGSSKKLCKNIYFEKLKSLKVASIGLFGSREEVLNMLTNFDAISVTLCNKLIDKECKDISAGIHAILPTKLQKEDNIKSWDGTIYLFYWSLLNSFNMNKMKAVKYMRKDPACLLSRVCFLHLLYMLIRYLLFVIVFFVIGII